ncbi:MAG: hypothetical protein AMJ46_06280 [Latescibacteria bacterium DG_63]|nr:MAG: hypothetical protein AMJ46_06280 [Latescibacteria bacterium DG_63]
MRAVTILCVLCVYGVFLAGAAGAATVTSSFSVDVPPNRYTYAVTPDSSETIKEFRVYASSCTQEEYSNWEEPPGWNHMLSTACMKCRIIWWTLGDSLPSGQAAAFGYTHNSGPCCHTWYVADSQGGSPIDASWNHPEEPCNIPSEYQDVCNGPGLVVAPLYPYPTPADNSTWGRIKSLYR